MFSLYAQISGLKAYELPLSVAYILSPSYNFTVYLVLFLPYWNVDFDESDVISVSTLLEIEILVGKYYFSA